MAAVSAEGSIVCGLMRRLNSSWSRSIALVVRAVFHWLGGSRVKVKSRSPASSRLSATALHLSRHLRMKARRPRSAYPCPGFCSVFGRPVPPGDYTTFNSNHTPDGTQRCTPNAQAIGTGAVTLLRVSNPVSGCSLRHSTIDGGNQGKTLKIGLLR
jgi:hypothetical protein